MTLVERMQRTSSIYLISLFCSLRDALHCPSLPINSSCFISTLISINTIIYINGLCNLIDHPGSNLKTGLRNLRGFNEGITFKKAFVPSS